MQDSKENDGALHPFRMEFRDPEWESEYRGAQFESDKRRFLLFVGVAFGGMFFYTLVETIYRSPNDAFSQIQLTRVFLLFGMALAGLCINYIRLPQVFDRAVLLTVLTISLVALAIPLLREPDYVGHYISDVLLIYSFYILVPIPLLYQLIPALLITGAELAIMYWHKEFSDSHYVAVIISSLVLVNVLGVQASSQVNRRSRQLYLKLKQEQDIHSQLQEILDRMELLEGMVPICASCKSIRNDEGYWEQVETILRRNTGVEFSHGICPDCLKTQYEMDMP